MDFLPEALNAYVEAHTAPESDVKQELNRETHLKVNMPQMLSGHIQGAALSLFSRMIRPRRILEIGTYTGYSAICFAEGLTDDGRLHTIDNNEELEEMCRRYWQKAGIADKIKLHIGHALDIIPTLDETFDLVFIDADKVNYSAYFDGVIDKVRQGGFIIADNVLWSGKVTQPGPDKKTKALMDFNNKVHADTRVENVLLPIRDGLMVLRKL